MLTAVVLNAFNLLLKQCNFLVYEHDAVHHFQVTNLLTFENMKTVNVLSNIQT
jgi:hypothetical protein